MLMSFRTKARIFGVELQKEVFSLGYDSVIENGMDKQIALINDDVKNISNYIEAESVDVVTCNPPYFKYAKNKSLINEDEEKAIARHEIAMNLDDLMTSAKYILKNKAPLYIVHRCDRLEEILECLDKYGFKVKKLQFIYAGYKKEAIMVLIKATKNGNSGSLKVMPPIDVLQYKSYKGIFEKGE